MTQRKAKIAEIILSGIVASLLTLLATLYVQGRAKPIIIVHQSWGEFVGILYIYSSEAHYICLDSGGPC